MNCSLYLSASFKRSIKLLKKRFPHIQGDISLALEEMARMPTLGVMIPGSGGVRKVRVRSSDLVRGKSGGFRLLYIYEPDQ